MLSQFYANVAKGLKLKVRKVFWDNSYVCRSYRGKTDKAEGHYLASHPD